MNQYIPSAEDVGRFYDHFTRFFEIAWGDSLHVGYWADGDTGDSIAEGQVRLTTQLMNRLDVPAGTHLLDVGCGTGEPTLRLGRDKRCQVTGVTISQNQVAAARQRAQHEGMANQVQFQHANAMALPFANESFAGAWALESLFHMSDMGQALREIHRCLQKGAPLAIADFYCKAPMEPGDEQFYRQAMMVGQHHALDAYQDILRASGFVLEECTEITPNMYRMSQLTETALKSRREDLRQAFGDEMLGMLDASWLKAAALGRQHVGYVLFRARKA